MKCNAVAWIEPAAGKVWRVEAVFRDWGAGSTTLNDVRLRVEFAMDSRLQTMVPVEMRETFYVPGGRGDGKATYRSAAKFQAVKRCAGARIVPQ